MSLLRRCVVVLGLLVVLIAPASAAAHPLGNFSINRFSRIEVSGPRVYVTYVLDIAEVPSYKVAYEAKHLSADEFAAKIAANAKLTVNGRPATLRPVEASLAHPPGAGGMTTTWVQAVLEGPVLTGKSAVVYEDTNYAEKMGWREIVVGAKTPSASKDLRAYPKDMLKEPLEQTSVSTSLSPGTGAAVPPKLDTRPVAQAPDRVEESGFTSLVAREDLSLLVILASLAAALFWGAVHALSPGHGKAVVTAYLVGQRGTPAHAALLGLIVTVTHTIGVFALGLITLALSQFIVPDQLYPWLNLAAGLLVVGIGFWVLLERVRVRYGIGSAHGHHHHHDDHGHDHGHGHDHAPVQAHGHDHDHGHDHHHGHDHAPVRAHGHDHEHHGHSHLPEQGSGLRGLIAVGVSGGLLPCPSALVVLLAAISLHRVGFGLALVVAFSLGLALTITAIGLVAVLAKRVFARVSFEGKLVSYLPAVSALVILLAGVAMTARAIPTLS